MVGRGMLRSQLSPERAKAAIAIILGGFWWAVDRLYGDEVWRWIKPMIPTQLSSFRGLLEFLVSYGPPIAFISFGVWLLWKNRRIDHASSGEWAHPNEYFHGPLAETVTIDPTPLPKLDLYWDQSNKPENIAKALHAMKDLRAYKPNCDQAVFQLGEAYREARSQIVGNVRLNISQSEALFLDERGLCVVTKNPDAFNDEHNSLLHDIGNFTESLRQLHRRYVDLPHA